MVLQQHCLCAYLVEMEDMHVAVRLTSGHVLKTTITSTALWLPRFLKSFHWNIYFLILKELAYKVPPFSIAVSNIFNFGLAWPMLILSTISLVPIFIETF